MSERSNSFLHHKLPPYQKEQYVFSATKIPPCERSPRLPTSQGTRKNWSAVQQTRVGAKAYHRHFLITRTPHPLFSSTDKGELRYLSSLIGIGSSVCIQAAFVCFRKLAVWIFYLLNISLRPLLATKHKCTCLGLGKSVTENWEIFDAICDKKQGIMR